MICCFNPRPRVASDGNGASRLLPLVLFQSTPACGERPASLCWGVEPVEVSIHARVWRATFPTSQSSQSPGCFNPRPRVASDSLQCLLEYFRNVSIHARVWRATSEVPAQPVKQSGFNPRPRVASDTLRGGNMSQNSGFNPRPRVASDRIALSVMELRAYAAFTRT